MKILLDECVTKKLKAYLSEFDVFTVTQLGWSGTKNGKLMTLCVENGFNVLVTIDKNLVYQQNMDKYPVSIAVFNSGKSKIEELSAFIPAFKRQLSQFEPNKIYIIEKS